MMGLQTPRYILDMHAKVPEHVLQHKRCTALQLSNRSAAYVSGRKALISWNFPAVRLACLSGKHVWLVHHNLAQGVCLCCCCKVLSDLLWSQGLGFAGPRLVNEPEVCTLALDLLRFNTISSWRISCKLRFMVLRPKLRTSSCAPRMKVSDILAAWNPVSMIA